MTRAASEARAGDLRVLVVEDEELTAQAHAAYVARMPGYRVVGTARTGAAALAALARAADAGCAAHLVLLDLGLPDMSGLDVARTLRAARADVDILVITADNELPSLRAAAQSGVVGYLVKPFTFAAFAARLRAYRQYHRALARGGAGRQQEIDEALAMLHGGARPELPKGLLPETLDVVAATLRSASAACSASELGHELGVSRVTARRYLEHLVDRGEASRTPRHGGQGRPELEYTWLA
ncbi:response regulator [Xylanimonas allomyrinae]|uniref:Transcriptional regulatory protein n=1 Tax=Xylanimonas allomyrinae TaxID=2509459 RepID=A0A4P6EMY9_9MICO|nr:response regulator [Xylanimonas allomyrinae]QAY64044.1 response regulator [Xylanimonas allomyrinae]